MNPLEYTRYGDVYYRQSNRPNIDSLVWLYKKDDDTYVQIKEVTDGWVVFKVIDHDTTGIDMTQLARQLDAQSAHRMAHMHT